MSDFYGALETTSFRVKDRDAFLADPEVNKIKDHALSEGGFLDESKGYFSVGWYGQYPSPCIQLWREEEDENGDPQEIDLLAIIERHILPGDVCQVGVSGNEKLRYIGGGLWWVTSKGIATLDGVTEWGTVLTESSFRQFADTFYAQTVELVPA